MRKLIATALMSIAAAAALPAGSLAARNPSGTGKPSQSCQEIEANGGEADGEPFSGGRNQNGEGVPGSIPCHALSRSVRTAKTTCKIPARTSSSCIRIRLSFVCPPLARNVSIECSICSCGPSLSAAKDGQR